MTEDGIADEGESRGSASPPNETVEQPPVVDSLNFRGRVKQAWYFIHADGHVLRTKITSDTDAQLRAAGKKQVIKLRDRYARRLMRFMGLQILFADVLMGAYLWIHKFEVSDGLLIAFFGSLVVEIIGLVHIVTRSIFPTLDRDVVQDEKQ